MVGFLPSCVFYLPNFCTSVALLSSFLSPSCAVDALSEANASISSLEAELEASRKAWDVAAAAKATAEKSTKSALAKAKKAEKALADANQERIQMEQAITKCLNQISLLLEVNTMLFPSLLICPFLYLLMYAFLFSVFVPSFL
jgi:septal ring factor EnvC (AmiA/AmiB activator)